MRKIWPYVLFYFALGVGFVSVAWDLSGELFNDMTYPDQRIGLLPGTLIGLAIIGWAYWPRKPRGRRDA